MLVLGKVMVTWSSLLGLAWLPAFGAVLLTSLSLPIEELLSVVWVLAFGMAGAALAFASAANRANLTCTRVRDRRMAYRMIRALWFLERSAADSTVTRV
jgi:hypothetical protein